MSSRIALANAYHSQVHLGPITWTLDLIFYWAKAHSVGSPYQAHLESTQANEQDLGKLVHSRGILFPSSLPELVGLVYHVGQWANTWYFFTKSIEC